MRHLLKIIVTIFPLLSTTEGSSFLSTEVLRACNTGKLAIFTLASDQHVPTIDPAPAIFFGDDHHNQPYGTGCLNVMTLLPKNMITSDSLY